MAIHESVFIHPTAIVDERVEIGAGTKIWVNAQVRELARIGQDCVISKDVYIDRGVIVGDRCKIQNGVSIYHGAHLEDEIFVGPGVVFTNDKLPRATSTDWKIVPTVIRRGASVGANVTLVCGVTLGEFCMVAAGSVVTRDVEPYTLVMGNPAKFFCRIDESGNRIDD